MNWWQNLTEWFLGLGEQYNVNPYIFGAIYIGAIPFFFICLRWTIKRFKNKKPLVIPALLTGLCFISAYLYLIVVGKNIPVWVYVFIGLMVIYGGYSSYQKIKKNTNHR